MKCKNCGKSRPSFWVGGEGYCDESCHREHTRLKSSDKWMVSVNGAFCQVKDVDPWTAAYTAIRRFARYDAKYTIHLSRNSSYLEFLDFVNVLEKAENTLGKCLLRKERLEAVREWYANITKESWKLVKVSHCRLCDELGKILEDPLC